MSRIEEIRKRTDEAERICKEDDCSDPVHFGPRKDIRFLLSEFERKDAALRQATGVLPRCVEDDCTLYAHMVGRLVREALAEPPEER